MNIQKLTIRDIGNSEGIIIPKSILKSLNLKAGSEINLIVEDQMLLISSIPPSLEDLLKTVKKGEKFTELLSGSSIGLEE